jgi:hypothetical protein
MTPTGHRLQDLAREDVNDAVYGGRLPIHPAGSYIMPPHAEAAARKFLANMDRLDPKGTLRKTGEFIQPFGLNHGRTVAARPMRYAPGTQAPDIPYLPDTFTVIHSHPKPEAGAFNNFPSGNDYLTAYDTARTNGHDFHMVYDAEGRKFYSYSGGQYPPVFLEAKFRENPPAGHS